MSHLPVVVADFATLNVHFKVDRLPEVERALINATVEALAEWCVSEDSVNMWEAKQALGTLWHYRQETPPAGEGPEGFGRCVG